MDSCVSSFWRLSANANQFTRSRSTAPAVAAGLVGSRFALSEKYRGKIRVGGLVVGGYCGWRWVVLSAQGVLYEWKIMTLC